MQAWAFKPSHECHVKHTAPNWVHFFKMHMYDMISRATGLTSQATKGILCSLLLGVFSSLAHSDTNFFAGKENLQIDMLIEPPKVQVTQVSSAKIIWTSDSLELFNSSRFTTIIIILSTKLTPPSCNTREF